MATVCEYCGHKTNEVKSGGGIEPKGKRISLKVTDATDMSRDVLKVRTTFFVYLSYLVVMKVINNIQKKYMRSKVGVMLNPKAKEYSSK